MQYNTLSNEEIWDIDVGSLSNTGFLFLWVLNSNLQFALQLMNNWGYTFVTEHSALTTIDSYVDRIVWVKKNRNSDGIAVSHGFYFLHSTELCLVGVKYSNEQQKLQYISKVTNDVLFSRIGAQSQKPEAMYEIINAMLPGARKIELFANNHKYAFFLILICTVFERDGYHWEIVWDQCLNNNYLSCIHVVNVSKQLCQV